MPFSFYASFMPTNSTTEIKSNTALSPEKFGDSLNNAENVSYYMAKKINPIRYSSLFISKMVIAPILWDAVPCTLHF